MIDTTKCGPVLEQARNAMRAIRAEHTLDAALAELAGWADGNPESTASRCTLWPGQAALEFTFRIDVMEPTGQYRFGLMGVLIYRPADRACWFIQGPGVNRSFA